MNNIKKLFLFSFLVLLLFLSSFQVSAVNYYTETGDGGLDNLFYSSAGSPTVASDTTTFLNGTGSVKITTATTNIMGWSFLNTNLTTENFTLKFAAKPSIAGGQYIGVADSQSCDQSINNKLGISFDNGQVNSYIGSTFGATYSTTAWETYLLDFWKTGGIYKFNLSRNGTLIYTNEVGFGTINDVGCIFVGGVGGAIYNLDEIRIDDILSGGTSPSITTIDVFWDSLLPLTNTIVNYSIDFNFTYNTTNTSDNTTCSLYNQSTLIDSINPPTNNSLNSLRYNASPTEETTQSFFINCVADSGTNVNTTIKTIVIDLVPPNVNTSSPINQSVLFVNESFYYNASCSDTNLFEMESSINESSSGIQKFYNDFTNVFPNTTQTLVVNVSTLNWNRGYYNVVTYCTDNHNANEQNTSRVTHLNVTQQNKTITFNDIKISMSVKVQLGNLTYNLIDNGRAYEINHTRPGTGYRYSIFHVSCNGANLTLINSSNGHFVCGREVVDFTHALIQGFNITEINASGKVVLGGTSDVLDPTLSYNNVARQELQIFVDYHFGNITIANFSKPARLRSNTFQRVIIDALTTTNSTSLDSCQMFFNNSNTPLITRKLNNTQSNCYLSWRAINTAGKYNITIFVNDTLGTNSTLKDSVIVIKQSPSVAGGSLGGITILLLLLRRRRLRRR